MKLGSWLIARGKITGVQLKRALLDQSFYGGHLSSSLTKLGFLDESTLEEYLSDRFQVSCARDQDFEEIRPEIIRIIPEQLAQKHQMVPLAVDGKKLRLAMMNPADILVMDEVAFLTGLQVEPWVSSETHLLDALERYYQLPRSSRETIPLADRIDGREDPLTARRRILEASDAPEPSAPAMAHLPAPGEELGLDGRPLSVSADAVTELYPTVRAARSEAAVPGPIPRSLDEWREDVPVSAPAGGEAAHAIPPLEAARPSRETAGGARVPPAAGEAVAPPPASAAKRPSLSLVPPAPLVNLEAISERLKNALTRDEVFEAVLDFCAGRFTRSALFLVTQDKVVGFSGRGEGFDPARIRATSVGLDVPSIFSYFRMGSEFYYGPVPGLPANQLFYRGLGLPAPERVLLLPIQIKERLIALVYGDLTATRREEPDVGLYRRLVQKAVLALEILILRNKITML